GGVGGAGEGLEQGLDNVVRFVAIKQFQVQVAARFVGEGLEEFARQAKAEGGGGVLILFLRADFFVGVFGQAAPDQRGPAAEVNDASGQALIHGDEGFGAQGRARVETGSV